jgi:hypothetical protein
MEAAASTELRRTQEEEQRFLPLFDSLASIEFLLDEALAKRHADSEFYVDLADALRWRNTSLFIPPNLDLRVTLPHSGSLLYYGQWYVGDQPHERTVRIPLRDAIGLTVDFIRAGVVTESLYNQAHFVQSTTLTLNMGDELHLEGDSADTPRWPPPDRDGPPDQPGHGIYPQASLKLDAEFSGVWKEWMYGRAEDAYKTEVWGRGQHFEAARKLLLALRREIARSQRDILMSHPALAEKYLAVRTNILSNKTHHRPPITFEADDVVRRTGEDLDSARRADSQPSTRSALSPTGAEVRN